MCGESRNASSLPGRPQWSQTEGGIAPLAVTRFACTGRTGPPTVNAPLPPGPKSESDIHGGRSCLNGLSSNWHFETKVISPDSVSLAEGGTSSLTSQVGNSNGHTIQLASGDQEGLVVSWSTSDSAVVSVDGVIDTAGEETGATETVTGIAAGNATITASWGSGSDRVTDTTTVTDNE